MQREAGARDARQTAQKPSSKTEADVWREGEWFVARARGVEVASQGKTRAQAIANLHEALELHFEDPVATLPPA